MSVDVLGYLSSKGIQTKRATGSNVHVPCWVCDEDPGKRGRLYVNVDPDAEIPGLYYCHLCGARGSFASIQRHFGDDPARQNVPEFTKSFKVLQEAAKYYHAKLLENPEKLKWLRQVRGLTDETINNHLLGWADGKLADHFAERLSENKSEFSFSDMESSNLFVKEAGRLRDFFSEVITIPYQSYGSVVQIRGKIIGGKYRTPAGAKARIFNEDSLLGASEVVIAEGEFDALIAEQMGYRTIAIPGAASWQDEWTKKCSEPRRFFAVFDNDEAGRKGIAKLKEKLGGRLRGVTIPPVATGDDSNDISAWIVEQGHTKQEFAHLLTKATGGLLVTVDDAYEEHVDLQGSEGLKLGFHMLDQMIRPGLLPSQVCVILAKTGTGKTISLLNVFHRMCAVQPDAKVLFVSLEQTRGDWFERARRIWAFHNIDAVFPASSDAVDLALYTEEVNQRTLDFWRPRLLMIDKNRVNEGELVASIEEYGDMTGGPPSLIAVDYLGYWASGFKGKDKYEKTSDAVMTLKAIAKDYRVPIIAPHQVNRMAEFGQEPDVDAARDSGAVEETADFVFLLWSPDTQKGKDYQERTGEVNMKIGKSRHGGKGFKERLRFSPISLCLSPLYEEDASRRAAKEIDFQVQNNGNLSWEMAMWLHHLDAQTF